jgi:hypothetical protein
LRRSNAVVVLVMLQDPSEGGDDNDDDDDDTTLRLDGRVLDKRHTTRPCRGMLLRIMHETVAVVVNIIIASRAESRP